MNTAIHSLPFNLKPHSLPNQSLPFIAKQHSLHSHSLAKFGVELVTLPACGRRPGFGQYCAISRVLWPNSGVFVSVTPCAMTPISRPPKRMASHSIRFISRRESLPNHSFRQSLRQSFTPCLCGDFQALDEARQLT